VLGNCKLVKEAMKRKTAVKLRKEGHEGKRSRGLGSTEDSNEEEKVRVKWK